MMFVFVFGVVASGIFFYYEVIDTSTDLRERTLQGQARDLLAGLRLDEAGKIAIDLPPDWAAVYGQASSGYGFTLYDPSGVPVANSANLAAPLPHFYPPRDEAFSQARFSGVGEDFRAYLAAGAPDGHILVIERVTPDLEMLAESFLIEESYEQFLVFVPFMLGSLLLIWLVSGWSLWPLAHASKDAKAINLSNLSVRIKTEKLPAEVRPLVNAINDALERLAYAYLAECRFTADAAHELRTPLSVLSLRLQRARDGAMDWPGIENDLARLTGIVGQLLDLARKDRAVTTSEIGTEKVNLARILREAAAQILPLAEEMRRSLDVDVLDTIEIHGRADDLRDMVINLLDNALVHGRGAVQLKLRMKAAGGEKQAVIEVSDEGPGPLGDLRTLAFERFRRDSSAPPGAGLGLAIVRQVARIHGGDAAFLAETGGRVQVTLPLSTGPGANV